MALNLATSGGQDFGRIEDGTLPARLVHIVDIGKQARDPYKGKSKPPCHQVIFTFEFPTELVDYDGELSPRWLSKTYNVFNSENAALPKVIKTLDPDGTLSDSGVNSAALAGSPATITIESTSGGKAKVGAVAAPMKGMEMPEQVGPSLVFDFDNPDMEVYEQLPEWMQNRIKESLDYSGSALQEMIQAFASDDFDPDE